MHMEYEGHKTLTLALVLALTLTLIRPKRWRFFSLEADAAPNSPKISAMEEAVHREEGKVKKVRVLM
jgi:hypothetical protein